MEKIAEIRDQADEQLENKLEDINQQIFMLRNELALNHKMERPHMLKQNKKTKARIMTVLAERKRGQKHAENK